MAPPSRKRAAAAAAGRPPRRARALAPITEDAELPKALSATSTGTQISESPERKAATALGTRRRPPSARELAQTAHDKRRQRALQLLEELEAKVERRCEELAKETEDKVKEMRMELRVQLMFLPEAVRKMPWKTFMEDFGGRLENVIQNVKDQDYRHYVAASPLKVQSSAEAIRPPPIRNASQLPPRPLATPAALSKRLHAFETPAFTPYTGGSGGVPGTVLRTARKGETTYSIRGSPIVPDTVVKAPMGSLVATFGGNNTDPTACITLDGEAALDLSNPDQLSEESRAQAKAKIQALQAKLDALLKQYK